MDTLSSARNRAGRAFARIALLLILAFAGCGGDDAPCPAGVCDPAPPRVTATIVFPTAAGATVRTSELELDIAFGAPQPMGPVADGAYLGPWSEGR